MTSTPFDRDSNPSATRYVILHHVGFGPDHWDVMIEQHGALATWKVYHHPCETANAQRAFRIGDHRLAYLTYEGAVSGGRGTVARVAGGRCLFIEQNSQCWRVRLEGAGGGQLELAHRGGDEWMLTIRARPE